MSRVGSVDLQLFCELKKYFPDLPEKLVTQTVKQSNNNREQCFDILNKAKQQHISAFNGNFKQMEKDYSNLGINEDRPEDIHHSNTDGLLSFACNSNSDTHVTYKVQNTAHRTLDYSMYNTNRPVGISHQQQVTPNQTNVFVHQEGNYTPSQNSNADFPKTAAHAGYNAEGYVFKPHVGIPPIYDHNGANNLITSDGNLNRPCSWQSSPSPQIPAQLDTTSYTVRSESPFPLSPFNSPVHDSAVQQQPAYTSQLFVNVNTSELPTRPQYVHQTQNQTLLFTGTQQRSISPGRQISTAQVLNLASLYHGKQTPGSEPGTPPAPYSQIASNVNNTYGFFPASTGCGAHTSDTSLDNQSHLLTSNDPDLTKITQQPIQPSPASSLSSLSSVDGQRVDGRTSRSNSAVGTPDDIAYVQALILHQRACLEKLKKVLVVEKLNKETLKMEIDSIESELQQRKRERNYQFPTPKDLTNLREEKHRLQIAIELMTREIDHYNYGQAPLGVIDAEEQQSFYSNMSFTGQSGPLRTPSTVPVTSYSKLPAQSPAPSIDPYPEEGDSWSCSACTFLNHPALDKCECCEMPRMQLGYR